MYSKQALTDDETFLKTVSTMSGKAVALPLCPVSLGKTLLTLSQLALIANMSCLYRCLGAKAQ